MEPHRRLPVIDMTPDGAFRDPPPRALGTLDRILARMGVLGVMVAAGSVGLVLAALALLAIGILLPVAIVAGAIGAGALWWRARRARRNGTAPRGIRFVIIRR
jgi:hypothetical protein